MSDLQSSINIHVTVVDKWIGEWRKATVEATSLNVPPHLTILWPWHPAPVDGQKIEALRQTVKSFGCLELTFDKVA